MVARLLEAGSKPGPVTDTGVQPLHLAAQAGNADAVKALLDRGADVNARDTTHGRTPLIFATSKNRARSHEGAAGEGRGRRSSRRPSSTTASDRRVTTQARQARDRAITAATGRATNSGLNINDPPPTGQAGGCSRRSGGGGRQVAPVPAAGARRRPAGSARRRRTSNRSGGRAVSPRCITPFATDTPTRRCCCSTPAWTSTVARTAIDRARWSSPRSTASTTWR